jgi:hypothetical protein
MARTGETDRLSTTLIGGLYCIAILLVGLSLLDYVATVWPVQLSEPRWRYGAVGLLSGFILTPLIGVVVAVALAVYRRQFVVLRVVGIVCLVLAALLCIICAGFALDAIQLRRDAAPETRRVGDLGAMKALVKLAAAIVATGWMGLGAVRQGRGRESSREEPSPIVVGR